VARIAIGLAILKSTVTQLVRSDDCWNKNVFSCWWKVAIDGDDWTVHGRLGCIFALKQHMKMH